MLPKSSPKWLEENGEWDAVTPFGVRILKPEVGEWREVSGRNGKKLDRLHHHPLCGCGRKTIKTREGRTPLGVEMRGVS